MASITVALPTLSIVDTFQPNGSVYICKRMNAQTSQGDKLTIYEREVTSATALRAHPAADTRDSKVTLLHSCHTAVGSCTSNCTSSCTHYLPAKRPYTHIKTSSTTPCLPPIEH
eukprot:17081-Heterococcus_DN1.PRE.1